jgi:hypothetical protein
MKPKLSSNVFLLLCISSLVACTTPSNWIVATDQPPSRYKTYDCDQLLRELASLTKQEASLAADLDKEAGEDVGTIFLAWLSFGIVKRQIGGNEALESRYASTLGRYDATLKAGFIKKCNLNPDVVQIIRVSTQASSDDSDSVLEFYGEAEEEINTNTYDKHLWDKALIETGGDQTKRKARYHYCPVNISNRFNWLTSMKSSTL